jgi:hypothetical protein
MRGNVAASRPMPPILITSRRVTAEAILEFLLIMLIVPLVEAGPEGGRRSCASIHPRRSQCGQHGEDCPDGQIGAVSVIHITPASHPFPVQLQVAAERWVRHCLEAANIPCIDADPELANTPSGCKGVPIGARRRIGGSEHGS